MPTKACSKCKAKVPINAKFCNICGNNEFTQIKKCSYCNNVLPASQTNPKFCPNCGKRIGSGSIKMKLILAPEGKKHSCAICKQTITNDLVLCPNCTNSFHFPHLANWILEKEECPMCKTKLIFAS